MRVAAIKRAERCEFSGSSGPIDSLLHLSYPFHKLNSERPLRELLDISAVQEKLNLREKNTWPKYSLSGVSEQLTTESCAKLPLLQVAGRSCLRFKRDLCWCAHFWPA
jgi:hypothetical protein